MTESLLRSLGGRRSRSRQLTTDRGTLFEMKRACVLRNRQRCSAEPIELVKERVDAVSRSSRSRSSARQRTPCM